jgi:hypothetical protein
MVGGRIVFPRRGDAGQHQFPGCLERSRESGLLGLKRYRAFLDQVGRRLAGEEDGVSLTAIGDQKDG